MMTEKKIRKWADAKRRSLPFNAYTLDGIKSTGSTYKMVIGERSNGKTYAVLMEALIRAILHGEKTAYIRRFEEDFRGRRGQTLFASFEGPGGFIDYATEGKWTATYYYGMKWYFARYDDEGKRVVSKEPFAYAFSLSSEQHDKSTSYPEVTLCVFDEFITRGFYLKDEFVAFMNVLSTIIRSRDNVEIYMLGNTVNRYCPYFDEMGLKHVKNMKDGTIDTYTYGKSDLTVSVEYCENSDRGKPSDKYFAFDNPRIDMITKGVWEIDLYPHCPVHFNPNDVIFEFFVIFDGSTLHCNVVQTGGMRFIFVHNKTTPIKEEDRDLIYSIEYDPRPNWRRNILKGTLPVESRIRELLRLEKVFYSTNEIGEVMRNYLNWCKT